MVTALDAKLVPKALAIIAKVGRSATVTVRSGATYDAATGKYTGGTSTPYTVTMTPRLAYEQRYVGSPSSGNDVIKAEDCYVLLAGSGLAFTPNRGQILTILGTTYRVIDVKPYETGDQIAAFELQLRR